MELIEGEGIIRVSGVLTVRVFDLDGNVTDERIAKNLMTTVGLNALAPAINWSGILDQNVNMGSPFTPSYLAPIFGAVGNGTNVPNIGDTQLQTELGRVFVTAAGVATNVFTWTFFFGLSAVDWTINEAGVFVLSSSTPNAATLFDHALVVPAVTKPAVQTATLTAAFTLS